MRRISTVLAATRAMSHEGNEGKYSVLLLNDNKTKYRYCWNKCDLLVK